MPFWLDAEGNILAHYRERFSPEAIALLAVYRENHTPENLKAYHEQLDRDRARLKPPPSPSAQA